MYKNSDCEYPFRKFTATSVDRILVNHFLILCLTDSIVKVVKEVEKHYLENQKYKNYIDKIQKHLNSEDWELFEYIVIKQFSYKKLGTIYHSSEAAIKMRWYRLQRKLRPFVDFITK